MFDTLEPQPADPIIALMAQFQGDPRIDKLDLGVGVYRDEHGATPVMAAVKEAERILLQTQATKSYLGPTGDQRFVELAKALVLGPTLANSDRIVGVQTPGGGGALRLAADLIAASRPGARIWIGAPTWPNHPPIMKQAGLPVASFPWFDAGEQAFQFDRAVQALSTAEPGDVVLLQGCCHNPTGADPTLAQWRSLAKLIEDRRLIPLLDVAYQGLGDGLDADASGARIVVEATGEAFVAYSCSKNFGLYRERTGALFVQTRHARQAATVKGQLAHLIRVNWSMPPDHGAAAVGLILETPSLKDQWANELAGMRRRLGCVRRLLADHEPSLEAVAGQRGMFSLLPLSPSQIGRLRSEFGVYVVDSGRVNLAGLAGRRVEAFAQALASVRREQPSEMIAAPA